MQQEMRAAALLLSQHLGQMDLLLGMLQIFPSIIIYVFVIVVLRCVHASNGRPIQNAIFICWEQG